MAHLSNDAPDSDQGCPNKHLAKTTVHSNGAVYISLKDLTLYSLYGVRKGVFVLLDPLTKIQLNLVLSPIFASFARDNVCTKKVQTTKKVHT